MTDSNTPSAFRFAYFTDKYKETCAFYLEQLELERELSWDRSEQDKGSTFKAGVGLIEVLHKPNDKTLFNPGLDYRAPQGAFIVIQVSDAEELYHKCKGKKVSFKQELTHQPWGHKSFSVKDPNGIVLFFYEDLN